MEVKSSAKALRLSWEVPGLPAVTTSLSVEALETPLLVGLLDLEGSFDVAAAVRTAIAAGDLIGFQPFDVLADQKQVLFRLCGGKNHRL